MDQNDLRTLVTVIAFVTFIGIVIWAYSRRRKHRFDEAANLPCPADEAAGPTAGKERSGQ